MSESDREAKGAPELLLRLRARMRARRDALGLSAREVGERTGVSRSTIANFEVGRTSMSVEDYHAIVLELGVEPDVLMREVVCERCGGLPPQGLRCTACGAGNSNDLCMACRGEVPAGFACKACGLGAPEATLEETDKW